MTIYGGGIGGNRSANRQLADDGSGGCMTKATKPGSAAPVTVFHNPACGTSRNVLALLREKGVTPTVVEYLKTGWTAPQLKSLLAAMNVSPRDILRERGTPAAELGLLASEVPEEKILAAMVDHPILVNRPIVVTPKGVCLARPVDKVLDLL